MVWHVNCVLLQVVVHGIRHIFCVVLTCVHVPPVGHVPLVVQSWLQNPLAAVELVARHVSPA